MIAAFIVVCFLGVISLIAIQAYNQPNFGRKVFIHVGIVILVVASIALFMSLNNREATFTHTTQRADYYSNMHFNKVMQIDYDIVHYDWRSWKWLKDGQIVNLTISDDSGNKIVTE